MCSILCCVARETEFEIASLVARYSYTYRLLDIGFKAKPKEKLYKKYPCPSRGRPLKRRRDLDILTDHFRENIVAITGRAKKMGADVLLVGPVINYLSLPGEWSGDVEPETQQATDDMVAAFSAWDHDAYARTRQALLAVDPESAMALFHDGLWSLRDGRNGEARDLLETALSVDRRPIRARPAYREALAAIAAADDAVAYIDMMDSSPSLYRTGYPMAACLSTTCIRPSNSTV